MRNSHPKGMEKEMKKKKMPMKKKMPKEKGMAGKNKRMMMTKMCH